MKRFWEWLKNAAHAVMSWLRTDGIQHLAVCALIVVAFGWIRPMWIAPLIALAIGVAKEVYDYVSGKGTAEWHDIICDLLGIALGFLFVFINSL